MWLGEGWKFLIVLLDDRPSDEKGIVTIGLLSCKDRKTRQVNLHL